MQIYDRRHRAQGRDSIHRQTVSVTVPHRSQCCEPRCPGSLGSRGRFVRSSRELPHNRKKKGAGLNNNAYWRMVQPRQKRDCTFTPTRDGTR